MKRCFMFFVVVFFMFLLTSNVCADQTVTFTWDANTEEDLAGYRLYQSDISGQYVFGTEHAVEDILVGTETVAIVTDNSVQYWWVLTAYDVNGNESGSSNEVTLALPDTTPPSSPGNLIATDTPDYTLIPQSQMVIAYVDSEEIVAVDRPAENAIDGVTSTFWKTEFSQSDPACPHEIVIDLGDMYLVGEFKYLPRQDGNTNGTVADYSIYVSEDGVTWGGAVATGTFANDTTEKEVVFSAGKNGSYIRFVALSEVNGNPWTTVAEINISGAILPD